MKSNTHVLWRELRLWSLLCLGLLSPWMAQAQLVRLDTTEGVILIELNQEAAPKTVKNFMQYMQAGHYNGLIFHRVIPTFMIQAGGYDAKHKERATRPGGLELESRNGLLNQRGTIAMARRAEPNSAGAQWFINVVDNPFLDAERARDGHGYAVFGKVVEGMDVVDRIKDIPTEKAPPFFENLPVKPVIIKKATLEKN